MLLSLLKYLRGFLVVTLTGRSPERFLNLCSKKNILIWNLYPNKEAGGFDFCISVRGFRETRELQKKTHTSLRIQKRCGAPFFLYRYRCRKLFAAGILCCILLLDVCSKYVWKIEINGTKTLSEDILLTWLKQQDKSFGTKIKEIDCSALEAALRSDYDVIAWTSVKLEGTKLTIDIQESLNTEKELVLPKEGAWDIVASEDARLTKIYTRQGTPQSEAGAVVSKGAVLISGRLDITDDSGEVAQSHFVVADGDAEGIVSRTYQQVLPRKYQKKVYTGACHTSYLLQLGSKYFPLQINEPVYSDCETVVADHQVKLLKNLYIPVHFIKKTRKEYVYEPSIYTKSEVEALARSGWNRFLENFNQKGIPIIVKNVKIETDKEKCVIRGELNAQLSIIEYAPTDRGSDNE